jgi:hypothetical protein
LHTLETEINPNDRFMLFPQAAGTTKHGRRNAASTEKSESMVGNKQARWREESTSNAVSETAYLCHLLNQEYETSIQREVKRRNEFARCRLDSLERGGFSEKPYIAAAPLPSSAASGTQR